MDRIRVLVVEEDPDARAILDSILTHYGYAPRVTHDGHDALALVRQPGVDLLIGELYVPHTRGPCVVAATKQEPGGAGVRVLVHTTRTTLNDRRWAARAECDGFLTKPCELADLMREVRRLAGPSPRSPHPDSSPDELGSHAS